MYNPDIPNNVHVIFTHIITLIGQGTVLATANILGLHSTGVELSRKRCKKAIKLNVIHGLQQLTAGCCLSLSLSLSVMI